MSTNNIFEKMITQKSSDGEEFIVTEEAKVSETISSMIDVDCCHNIIPLPNITSKILAKVIEYCKKHISEKDVEPWKGSLSFWGNSSTSKDRENWDAQFLNVDRQTLFDLMLAASYLKIQGLVELTCKNVANQIKGKPLEEIRNLFHIVNDYTPEEEEQLRREHSWAFGFDD